jgi:hypothetical protein
MASKPGTKTVIKQLHPTLKACACGYIGSRTQLYKHFDTEHKQLGSSLKFFAKHGEVPLNLGDARLAHAQQFITACTAGRSNCVNRVTTTTE